MKAPTCYLLGLDVDFCFDVLRIDVVHCVGGRMDPFALIQNAGCIVLILGHFLEVLLLVIVLVVRGTLKV